MVGLLSICIWVFCPPREGFSALQSRPSKNAQKFSAYSVMHFWNAEFGLQPPRWYLILAGFFLCLKQVLCRALGGKTGRASGGWDIGLRRLILVDGLSSKYSGLQMPSLITVIECHQDQVLKVPLGAEILASSEKTGVEMFALGGHILGIQGHPEYTTDILLNIVGRLIENGLIEEKTSEEVRASLENSQPDRETWQKLCKSFLKAF